MLFFVKKKILKGAQGNKGAKIAPLLPCALFKSFYLTDNNTDLDVNVNERTKGEQHTDM